MFGFCPAMPRQRTNQTMSCQKTKCSFLFSFSLHAYPIHYISLQVRFLSLFSSKSKAPKRLYSLSLLLFDLYFRSPRRGFPKRGLAIRCPRNPKERTSIRVVPAKARLVDSLHKKSILRSIFSDLLRPKVGSDFAEKHVRPTFVLAAFDFGLVFTPEGCAAISVKTISLHLLC